MITSGQTVASSTALSARMPLVTPVGLPNSSRAAVAVAETGFHSAIGRSQAGIVWGETSAALPLTSAVAGTSPKAQLSALIAERARGQLLGGEEGRRVTVRAEALLRERGLVNARRFARLFVPGLEEVATPNR